MRCEWDENKRRRNLIKHRIDFAAVEKVLSGPTVTVMDERYAYHEPRALTFGLLERVVVAIAHIETDDVFRVISIRKANKNEQEIYFTQISD